LRTASLEAGRRGGWEQGEEMNSRREFLKKMVLAGGMMAFGKKVFAKEPVRPGQIGDPSCTLFRAVNVTPAENMARVIDLAGEIEKVVGQYDVVVIKPNVQWWNQGAPNLQALQRLVDMAMNRPGGFKGEVVIAENVHRGSRPWESKSSGWARTFEWNSDVRDIRNMNQLCEHLKKRYGDQFSVCHWIDVDSGGKRVFDPKDGPGYVYCDGTGDVPLISFDNGLGGEKRRAVIMTYPIFETDKGTIIDFKNGVWEKGAYTGQPLRFINFAALNHHSTYCGATSAVKNYLGISDLSGGPDPHNGGQLTGEYYNFHSFPFNKWAPGPRPGMIGAEIGCFMSNIRKADLNITTAEWVGLASRVKPPMARTRAVLACTDATALDYHATKYLLYPNSGMAIHNPDDPKSPLHQYLWACAQEGGGVFDETKVEVKSYDCRKKAFQENDELVVKGEKRWDSDPKTLLKYFLYRYLKT
ncbi:MAG: hypothetical protein DRG82_17270, partial [Deltaproteobacteria bacterium]